MSHVNRLKMQIPANRVAPVGARAIGLLAASLFRLLDAGATGAARLIGTLRPRMVRVEMARVIERLSKDRPSTAANLERTLKNVGNH